MKPLWKAVEEWIGTPYLLGGETKQGVDCSGFVLNVLREVYDLEIPDMTMSAIKFNSFPVTEINEGVLIFFNRINKPAHHGGIIINANEFVHASTSRGVTITKLDNKYWNSFDISYGRFNLSKYVR